MQECYENLYDSVEKHSLNKLADIYKFLDYKFETQAMELHQYQLTYGHVVHKYEKMRSTKLWKVAKKIKAKIKGK